MPEVYFHIARRNEAAAYSVRHVLETMLGWEVAELQDPASFAAWAGPKLIYGSEAVAGAFHVMPSGAIGNANSPVIDPARPFPVNGGHITQDIFAAVVHRLMLLNEFGAPLDAHGRPDCTALVEQAKGTHLRPLVDEWALELADEWRHHDPSLPPVRRVYRHVFTCDVDNGFKYLGREAWRTLGSAARDLLKGNWRELRERFLVLSGYCSDPYDIYAGAAHLVQQGVTYRSIFNFLVADRSEHDHAVGVKSPRMRARISEVAGWAEVGIHPSYRSCEEPGRIRAEMDRLEEVIKDRVTIGRQHFLRFKVPESFRALANAGIREEFSIGYSDTIGFRAGTCTPYRWFDVERDVVTDLVIWPFQVMDSALAYRMALPPQQAISVAREMVDHVRAVNGTFIGVWHERFISGDGQERGWEEVVENVIRYAAP